ncbi:MAG: RDD family protein [Crenarchaeota archaeon]|nr:MAG: RDD family protein [Thermoproteota archaeon]
MYENKITLAKWSHRFLAWLIDIILVSVVVHLISYVIFGTSILMIGLKNLSFNFDARFFYFIGFGLLDDVVYLFYWAILEKRSGQSIGKMVLKIKTTDLHGQSISFRDSIVQSFGKTFLLPIDVIVGWIFTNKNRQRLFNKISDTIVIKQFSSDEAKLII